MDQFSWGFLHRGSNRDDFPEAYLLTNLTGQKPKRYQWGPRVPTTKAARGVVAGLATTRETRANREVVSQELARRGSDCGRSKACSRMVERARLRGQLAGVRRRVVSSPRTPPATWTMDGAGARPSTAPLCTDAPTGRYHQPESPRRGDARSPRPASFTKPQH
jgi:hypothetical protein